MKQFLPDSSKGAGICAASVLTAFLASFGDKLKLRLFKSSIIGKGGGGGSTSLMASLYWWR